jgi:hypothetical protein
VRLTGVILGALYSDLRDTALVVRALCRHRLLRVTSFQSFMSPISILNVNRAWDSDHSLKQTVFPPIHK